MEIIGNRRKRYYVTTVFSDLDKELANRIGLLGCFKINHEHEIVICHHFYGILCGR